MDRVVTFSKLVTFATFEQIPRELKSGHVQLPVEQDGVAAARDSLVGLKTPIFTACCMLRSGTPATIS